MKTFTEFLSDGVTLSAYLSDPSEEMKNASCRPAVLVLPGGGYYMCSDREAEPIAVAFLAQGCNAFILRYTVGNAHTFAEPLRDAENALCRIRSMAEEWHIHPQQIAVCGFSAGGHLAAALGVMGKERPNAMILGYPCILDSMNPILAFPVPSLDSKVTAETPPAFLFHTANDNCVPVENSLRFADALSRANVPFELHIFPSGPHGLALATALTSSGNSGMVVPSVAEWMPLCARWLKNLFSNFETV